MAFPRRCYTGSMARRSARHVAILLILLVGSVPRVGLAAASPASSPPDAETPVHEEASPATQLSERPAPATQQTTEDELAEAREAGVRAARAHRADERRRQREPTPAGTGLVIVGASMLTVVYFISISLGFVVSRMNCPSAGTADTPVSPREYCSTHHLSISKQYAGRMAIPVVGPWVALGPAFDMRTTDGTELWTEWSVGSSLLMGISQATAVAILTAGLIKRSRSKRSRARLSAAPGPGSLTLYLGGRF